MTIDELIKSLGIENTEDASDKIKTFLDGSYIPKARFNEVNEKYKTASEQLGERDKQLETLSASAKDSETLKKQIEEMKSANAKAIAEQEERYKALKLETAIKTAVAGDAYNADIVSQLIDKSKIVVGDDGKYIGLDEQIKTLKEEQAFLFKGTTPPNGFTPNKGGTGSPNNPFAKETFNLTEQGRLLREHPEQAKALASEAGVKI